MPQQQTSPSDSTPASPGPSSDFGANEWLVEEMFEQFQRDPGSVDPTWASYFKAHPGGSNGANGTNGSAASAQPAKQPAAQPDSEPATSRLLLQSLDVSRSVTHGNLLLLARRVIRMADLM